MVVTRPSVSASFSAQMWSVLVSSMMMHDCKNNGKKKMMTVRIVNHAFEIIHFLTDKNPLQVYVDAAKNGGPREESTRVGSAGVARVGSAGVVRRQAVDVSPSPVHCSHHHWCWESIACQPVHCSHHHRCLEQLFL